MSDDWEKAKRIFAEAIKLDPELRLQYLNEVCAEDADTRREVESLLNSFDDAESFMEKPAAQEVADVIKGNVKRLEKGKCFGNYEVIEKIGSGGMGEVYLARDKKLDRRVAVKILNEKFAGHEPNLNRFIREAKAASALNHPYILTIYEIGESEDAHFIVSEYIEGKTLREIIGKGNLQLPEILDVAIQIANALSAAHTAHIVHRDIKPENIMIRSDDFVKILDFGLAKLIAHQPIGFEETTIKQNETAQGVIMGTVSYMSPEQAKGERVDARSDIFSLGVLIYEMITGRTPFASDSVSETFANLIKTEPEPLSHFAANVPDELQRVVSKMLLKNKDERYQTMRDVLADLKNLKENPSFATSSLSHHPTERIESPKNVLAEQETIKQPLITRDEKLSATNEKTVTPFRKILRAGMIDPIPPIFLIILFLLIGIASVSLLLDKVLDRDKQPSQPAENNLNEENTLETFYPAGKKYLEMSDRQKFQFVSVEADKILKTIQQGEENEISFDGIVAIKNFVDSYATRRGREIVDKCGFSDNLEVLLKRGERAVPLISPAFNKRDIAPHVGIYLALVESEFCVCLQSPTGPLGMFQFTHDQAIEYGLKAKKGASPKNPDLRCEPEIASKAAAVLIKKLVAEDFGDGKNKMTFAIAAFNASNSDLAENIEAIKNTVSEDSLSFWTLIKNKDSLSKQFQYENYKYLPKFFAAAIVGENPKNFGVEIEPLSTFANKPMR